MKPFFVLNVFKASEIDVSTIKSNFFKQVLFPTLLKCIMHISQIKLLFWKNTYAFKESYHLTVTWTDPPPS